MAGSNKKPTTRSSKPSPSTSSSSTSSSSSSSSSSKTKITKAPSPPPSPTSASASDNSEDDADDESNSDGSESDSEEYDSEAEAEAEANNNNNSNDDSEEEEEPDFYDSGEDDGFEDQGSSSEDESPTTNSNNTNSPSDEDPDSEDDLQILPDITELTAPRTWGGGVVKAGGLREAVIRREIENLRDDATNGVARSLLHIDDLSSDDEEGGNTIGRVPLHWYDEYDHIGYKNDGTKVMKGSSSSNAPDALDKAIAGKDDPKSRWTIHDSLNGVDVTLTPRQIEIIRRIQAGAVAHPEHNANPDYVDYYTSEQEISGLHSNRYEPKHRFQPSRWEALQVRRMLKKLKDGDVDMDYLTGKRRTMQSHIKTDGENDETFELWKGDEEDDLNERKGPMHIAAPKVKPPVHGESYNPPGEYIPTEDEVKAWEDLDPADRPYGLLIPKKFPNLRSVGAYEHAVRERFERCLDLYLCPRAMKRRLNIDPESLVPQLPKASDLKPFPTVKCVKFVTPCKEGEVNRIRDISASKDGQYLASGADDGVVRLWEVSTGRLLRSWDLNALNMMDVDDSLDVVEEAEAGADEKKDEDKAGGVKEKEKKKVAIVSLKFNPVREHHVLLVGVGKGVVIINTGTGNADDTELTDALLSSAIKGGGLLNTKAAKAVKWSAIKTSAQDGDNYKPLSKFASSCGPIAMLKFTAKTVSLMWHKRGDYFVTVSTKAGAASVLIHQLSKGTTQQPFSRSKADVQAACFHPSKPFLFVCTNVNVRIYHLIKQTMVKKLTSGCQMISSIDVHPSGDHVIIGSLDRRMAWFDLDLSASPYKTLKYHTKALRNVAFHPRYPLMASCSDDGNVHVFHATVYSDLLRNPLIIPVKVLKDAHPVKNRLGALGCVFHPTQPWIFTCGADGGIHMWQDV